MLRLYSYSLDKDGYSAKDFKRGCLSLNLEISLAKFKKKKSSPTPDPKDVKEIDESTEIKDIPPTEKVEPSPPPPQTSLQSDETKRKIDKLFWLRIGLAVIGGIIATFIFEPIEGEERRWASIGFMIIIFIFSVFIGKGMRIRLPSSDRKKLVTTGIGSYVFIYLFVWILSYTLVNISENQGGLVPSFP